MLFVACGRETGTGFDEGRLVRIDNECGAFVGCVDMAAYASRHEVDTSGANREPPFEPALFGWNHFVEEGMDSGLEIPITQVIPPCLSMPQIGA